MAEVQHRFDLFHRAILQHQLRQGTKRHFLAMVQMVALFEDGETVVNGVRGGQTATFKADTAEVGIRFNDAFQRIGHHPGLGGEAGFFAFRQQRIIAQARQAQRRRRRLAARHAGGSGVVAGLGFKPG